MKNIMPPGRKSRLTGKTETGILIHEKAVEMPRLPVGHFSRMPGTGEIFAFSCGYPAKDSAGELYSSSDEGLNWEKIDSFPPGDHIKPSDSGAFICAAGGTLVAAFSNVAEKENWAWDRKINDAPGAKLPAYAVRSTDGGKTWENLQKLHEEWTGANRDIIQTGSGRIVFTSMKLYHNPGRHTVLTYASDDEGRTWTPSNTIDLGGSGDHGGVTEASLLELKGGRLLKYIRTNWGQFWTALSDDEGSRWHPYGPSGIDASSAPCMVRRLADEKIILLWNRCFPEDGREVELKGGDGSWSATPVSNFREELTVSFSSDECESWSPPVVLARNPGSEVSYPDVFEAQPGVLWITAARFGGLRIQIRAEDLL